MDLKFEGEHFTIEAHPCHHRLLHIRLHEKALAQFLNEMHDITEQRLSYVPYLRLMVADALQTVLEDG